MWSRFGLHPRKLFSSSNRLAAARIAQQLPGYSYSNIICRLDKLRAKPKTTPPSTGKYWEPHEDAVLTEKREAGMQYKETLPFLPDCSLMAARGRHVALKKLQGDAGAVPRHNRGRRGSPEEIQRVTDMVLVDGLPFEEIAKIMGRTGSSVQLVWQKHGRDGLPANMLKKFRGDGDWTAVEDEILIGQRKKGLSYKDIGLKIPGRNLKSLSDRARNLGIARLNLSATEVAAIRRELQAVLDGTATYEEVASKFSSTSAPSSVINIWRRMRYGY
ncbi:hypothetical protein Q7P35_011594 [Cladosporium inversicolor]